MKLPTEIFDQLYFQYVASTNANKALSLWKQIESGQSTRKLKSILRHHNELGIGESLTRLRDAFDNLLGFYSMLEVGYALGFLSGKMPASIEADALHFLNNPFVQKYYELDYELLLPQLFRRRLHGENLYLPFKSENGEALFYNFLDVNSMVERDEEIESFLWFLDGGELDETNIEDLLKTIGDKKEFLRRMQIPEKEIADGLTSALQGFCKFLPFTRSFLEFLSTLDEQPLVQSVVWHYHGYWFDFLRLELANTVRQACELATDAENIVEQKSLLEGISILTSGRFAWPIREVADEWEPDISIHMASGQRVKLVNVLHTVPFKSTQLLVKKKLSKFRPTAPVRIKTISEAKKS